MLKQIIAAALLAGCATDPASVKALADAQAKINSAPTMTIKCASGCEASYTDPRDRGNIAMPTNGWDAVKSAVSTGASVITGVAPWAAVGAIAVRGLREAGGDNNSVITNTSATSTNNQIGPDSANTTSGDAITTTDSHDATAEPVVVLQPSPVLVYPEVVNPVVIAP